MLGKGRGHRSPELLWSKDQAASRLNHRRSASRLLKLVGAPNRFQNVVAGVRTPVATLPVGCETFDSVRTAACGWFTTCLVRL